MSSRLSHIAYILPENNLTNEMLAAQFPEWPAHKIGAKTGIYSRSIAACDEYSLELAEQAVGKFFLEYPIDKMSIDFILFCTQTPKYLIATQACMIQSKFNLSQQCGAMDINLGCSGYPYALMLADSLIKSKIAKKILIITADTYTKLIAKENRQLRTLFSDAATVSLMEYDDTHIGIQSFVCGTDGAGANKLISMNGGLNGLMKNQGYLPDLQMDGPDIFQFASEKVPVLVNDLLCRAKKIMSDVDLFVFHQANKYLLDHLQDKIKIPSDKFFCHLDTIGNTISSSIPIALTHAKKENKLKRGDTVLLAGFGVGLSWSGVLLTS